MRYRRAFVPGGTWFFTVVTAGRQREFVDGHRVGILRGAFRAVRAKYPFDVDAIVVLEDHLHCILTLPPGDGNFALRWRLIKSWYTKHRCQDRPPVSNRSRLAKGQQMIWQNRYWEHLIRDEADLRHHIDYIHFNPVKHGCAERPRDWPWSSFHVYVRRGMLTRDWGDAGVVVPAGVGEE